MDSISIWFNVCNKWDLAENTTDIHIKKLIFLIVCVPNFMGQITAKPLQQILLTKLPLFSSLHRRHSHWETPNGKLHSSDLYPQLHSSTLILAVY
jgi:hypothetical protein